MRYMRRLRASNRAVTGLPLNLLIMVVIAAVAIGIILAWLYAIEPPVDRVEVSPNSINLSTTPTASVTITAYNSRGPMSGVEVHLDGAGVDWRGITDSNGEVQVSITPDLGSQQSGVIKVFATGGGNTEPASIAVNAN